MNGILVVDKPKGPTSHDICQYFKRTLPVKKVGHAGTLDPMATGVLVILLDGATKLQSVFLGKDKEYEFTMKLGETTDTYDAEGKLLEQKPVPDDYERKLKELLPQFSGEILQTPPAFSAIKKNGKPLYKLAREGRVVQPEPRKIQIRLLEILKTDLPEATLRCRCSSGTYIRSLAHDLGQRLGCGAHVTALRRLASEPFTIEEALPVDWPSGPGSAGNQARRA
ncbi:MAG: tRNA pseudouridine(55) synthase TruB [Deltaproteobacteria bacterium]|nr:tRNA pseudouridine(55) synthase TruB [Deltaproteobacteria bacterium]